MAKRDYIHGMVISTILIVVLEVYSFHYFGELHPVIAAIGGLLFYIPIRFFWLYYMSPELIIKHVENYVRVKNFYDDRYSFSRIVVENKGKSAAKNCKGYIDYNVRNRKYKERVCWTVPKERPNATINVMDDERLDFCAICNVSPIIEEPIHTHVPDRRGSKRKRKLPIIISPPEWGRPKQLDECRILDGITKCKVFITADNADPISAPITIDVKHRKISKN